MKVPFEYVKNTYKVPAEMHREVIVGGKKGVITECMGNYLHLYIGCKCELLDDDGEKRRFVLNAYNLNYYRGWYSGIKPILRPTVNHDRRGNVYHTE